MLPSATDAYSALSSFKPQNPQDVINNANTQAGVNSAETRVSDLRGAVANLNTSLNAVDPSVTGRTSGTFTTEAQRQALVSKEQQPIQTDLTARNQDLNLASGDLTTAQGRSNTLASAILAQDKDTYQRLLDQYNASSAYEKQQADQNAAAAAAQLERDKLNESIREFNHPQTGGGPTLNNGGGSTTPSTKTDPVQQAAYNDVNTRIQRNDNSASLISDFNATAKSAGYGNLQDQYKVQIYKQLRPDLFGNVQGYNQISTGASGSGGKSPYNQKPMFGGGVVNGFRGF